MRELRISDSLVRLGSLLTGIDAGHSPDLEDSPAGPGEWGVLKVSAVREDGFHPEENKVVRDRGLFNPTICVHDGDLLITRANTAQLVGRSCIAENVPPGLMLCDKTLRLRVDERIIPTKYVHMALSLPEVRRQIEVAATGTSGSMKNISQQSIRQLMIPIDSPETVTRLVEVIDSIDDLINTQQKMRDKRRALIPALAESYMRETVKYPSIKLNSIIESAVDGPFGSNLKSEHYVEEPGTRVVRLQNIGVGEFLDNDRAYVSNHHAASLASHVVRSGDLIVASLGDKRHPIARACIYPDFLPAGIVKADCFRIRLDSKIAINHYVMQALNSSMLAPRITAATQGVTRDRINLGSLLCINIPAPPLSFQRDMMHMLDIETQAVYAIEHELVKLRTMRQGLMRNLLTGRTRVPTR